MHDVWHLIEKKKASKKAEKSDQWLEKTNS